MRHLVALAAATTLGVAVLAPSVADACEPVTLTTYNAAFIVAPADTEDNFHRPAEQRAAVIAAQLLAERPDVIALQEVFDDDAREVFVRELAATYPFYVEYLDTHDELNPNELHGDSGLMLFSRFPFLPFETAPLGGDVRAFAGGARWNDVKFLEFVDNQGSDWWANKGVGMVKIAGPCERQLVIAFTHLQASYDDDDAAAQASAVAIRASQLRDIRDMLSFDLTSEEQNRVEVYVLGDLNIDANPTLVSGSTDTEWQTHFDPNRAGDPFFKTNVTETWPVEPTRRDVALTEGAGMPGFRDPTDGHRFDYVLRRNPPAWMPACVQHVRVDRAVGVEADGTSLSDHLPVTASTHRVHDLCSPHSARPVALPDEWIGGSLDEPGMMQWHRVDQAGSYAIDVFGPDIGFDVYEAKDISRPLRPSRPTRTDWGWRFAMPEAPFYIRVRGNTRSAQGSYALHVHKNQGGHPEDAILLQPAISEAFFMPSWQLNGENAVWFTFDTDVSDAGQRPDLALHAFSFSWPFDLFLHELDANRNAVPLPAPPMLAQWSWPFHAFGSHQLAKGEYYVKAMPWWGYWWPGMHLAVRFETNLTYATPETVACHVQDDDLGDDDIWLSLSNDGNDVFGAWRYLREFDGGDNPHPMAASGVGVQRYISSLYVELWDTDDGPSSNDMVGMGWIPTLSPGDSSTASLFPIRWRWPQSDYSMRWRLSHSPPRN